MMFSENYNMAIAAIRSSKIRSFLTMLGVIIGVVSVVTIVSLGEGVKNQINDQIGELGNDLITIQPGQLVNRDDSGRITGVNLFSTLGVGALSEKDLEAIEKTEGVKKAVPMSIISGAPERNDQEFNDSVIIATTPDFLNVTNHELDYGSFFEDDDIGINKAVIGRNIAIEFFGENVPIGKSMEIRDSEFVVNGVFSRFESNFINPTLDLNNAIFIPHDTGKNISGDTFGIFQILAKTENPEVTAATSSSITENLSENYGSDDDFTVLEQEDTLAVAQDVVSLVTNLVAGIAAVSLLIGGIGIMNVMLVSVSERTREVGIRKSIGATNKQIRQQFLIEAIVLSIAGAIIGLFLSLLINIGVRIFTDLQPAITPQIAILAVAVSVIVGVIFGLAPAVKASLKDPIESLRSQ